MYLILDIETAPLESLNSEGKPEDALSPITGRVIAIGMRWRDEERIIMDPNEKKMLSEFWSELRAFSNSYPNFRLVGFNVIDFDMYFLINRSLHHNVKILRLGRNSFLDLREHVTLFRPYRKGGSLIDYARLIGVEGKYEAIEGRQIPGLWKEGRIEDIRAYLSSDLRITQVLLEQCIGIGLIET
ncbi:hypothetical protein COT48_03805 [Candidatus Woesearchaeota archaeon CG08_land_8_20_14_0_20_47_9]|nr:MAG: hypothetical protein AUJ69_00065 [Candidatus Woesearchaeota archaeon CG1_02_47_18]PIN72329.1 MAG: hypothetical protein COV22_03500 [Candidatus Woesearchaeota archaeon CG10_big_fil_rev_8_21_14_0_10_47_5]PIO03717.1 MAG: hypothetical protein COT48_03805 [Candidatus Woesearchaeota archaeon CG08_land_8_20_14_0_20_47_9]HII29903.1 hypothetical protein [Candidatus Woesearchaeota archaeon]